MYIIRHKETKKQLGKHYSTIGAAKGTFKTAHMMLDKTKRRWLKFSEQDIYEVVKEETPEMVALGEAIKLLDRASNLLTKVNCHALSQEIDEWLEKQK